jgi:hypothetical protein
MHINRVMGCRVTQSERPHFGKRPVVRQRTFSRVPPRLLLYFGLTKESSRNNRKQPIGDLYFT